ncbi:alpha/beta hydrolase [Silvimonas soli]|uniref:alpha/beta hydrolase n=1 Tax=Silvimonas soli TaxID=2980100 RepID=UPI0024B39329|nr:alpha/beta hydrolase [Silvimonas soli]
MGKVSRALLLQAIKAIVLVGGLCQSSVAHADYPEQVIDVKTRPDVTQRFLYIEPPSPKAVVVLYAGGNGGLRIDTSGHLGSGNNNFLVRTRQQFASSGFAVAVIDAPSDRQDPPYLNGFRQSAEHATDSAAVIAWIHEHTKTPVWLIGTSRGTQSVAAAAIRLAGSGGPDGIVLTSTILTDDRSTPVPAMDLTSLRIPVLVVHHQQDGCMHCPASALPGFMDKLVNTPRKMLIMETGGQDKGDACEALAHHGFNGIEAKVVQDIADWISPH